MTLLADPADWPALSGGGPLLLLGPGADAPGLPGLARWHAVREGAGWRLWPKGGAGGPARELPAAPGAVLALLESEPGSLDGLAAAWASASGLPAPPVLRSGDAAGLAARLGAALSEALDREAALGRALLALREEQEETRVAFAWLGRAVSARPPGPLRLVLDGEAGSGRWGEPGLLDLALDLGLALPGLAAVGLHLAEGPGGPGVLTVRLLGAESGRVAGCWRVPHPSLAPGWLVLDLPEPCGPWRETAWLEARWEGGAPPALSPDPRWAGPDGDRPPAARAWSAEPGGRHLWPDHWEPREAGAPLPPPGAARALPAAALGRGRALAGEVAMVALGDEPPRPVLLAPPGGDAEWRLPHLWSPGMDVLRLALSPAPGAVASLAALTGDAVVSASGERPLDEGAVIHLALPVGGLCDLSLNLRAGPAGARCEVSEAALLSARPAAERLRVEPPGPPHAPPPAETGEAEAPAAAEPRAVPRMRAATDPTPPRQDGVRLHQHLPGDSYRHLDATVLNLSAGGRRWPALRLKLALKDGEPRLEFRQAPGWPVAFERWPGRTSDRFGPFLRATGPELPGLLSGASVRDAAMLRALLALLPDVAEAAAAQGGLSIAERAAWRAAATTLVAGEGTAGSVP